MKGKTLILVILAVAGIAVPATAACVWEAAPSFPTGDRRGAFAVNQNGTLVAIGGRPFVGGESASVHYLSPGGTTWQSGQPLEHPVMQPGAGVDASGRILVFGGWSFDDTGGGFFPLNIGFEYDATTGVGDGIAMMSCSRAFFAVAADNQNRFYVIGGRDRAGSVDITTDCVERYDPDTDSWASLALLPEPRSDAAAVYDGNGHILVIGGADDNGNTQSTVFSYDIASGMWSTISPQPATLERQGAVLGGDGRVYVVGGFNSNSATSTVSIYDPATGMWSTGPSLITARWGASVARDDDGFIYAMGGWVSTTTGTNTVERLGTVPLGADCNGNGVPDECETDCNGNGVPDDCDIDPSDPDGDGLVSPDNNGNGVPDECEECLDHADCNDGIACTIDTCDLGTSTCTNTPDDSACHNTIFCDGVETCDVLTGCQAGSPPSCDDGVACTIDECDAVLDDCTHTPNDAACDNGVFCDGIEWCGPSLGCQSGGPACPPDKLCREADDQCVDCLEHADCDDNDPCSGTETCASDGTCTRTLAADCNGNDIEDSCDIAVGTSEDANLNGIPDECECPNGNCASIPTVSEWGLLAMTLLVLTAGSLVLRSRTTCLI